MEATHVWPQSSGRMTLRSQPGGQSVRSGFRSECYSQGAARRWHFNSGGNRTTGVLGDGGPATEAQFNGPTGLAVNASGDVYVFYLFNHRIRRISRAGIITTIAGTGRPGFSGDGGPAVDAQLAAPRGIAIDRVGNLFVADSSNMRIRRIAIGWTINTVAGSDNPGRPANSGGPALQANSFPYGDWTVDDAGVVIFSAESFVRARRSRMAFAYRRDRRGNRRHWCTRKKR